MKDEANFTNQVNRPFASRVGYRKLPVQFVKAKEVYNPSDFIKALTERNGFKKILTEVELSDTSRESSSCSDNNMSEPVVFTRDMILSYRDEEGLKEIREVHIDSVVSIDTNIATNTMNDSNLKQGESEPEVTENAKEPQTTSPYEDSLEKGSNDAVDDSESDSEEDQSDGFDENALSALSFLVSRDMEGGDDIYIEDSPSPVPQLKGKSSSISGCNSFVLKDIEKIVKTSINAIEELEFEVHRSLGGSSTIVESITYEDIIKDNLENGTISEIDSAIISLGGILNTDDIKAKQTKLPSDISDMISALSNMQGSKSKKGLSRDLEKLSRIAKKTEPSYDRNSKTRRKDRPPSFSDADPSMRDSLIQQWHRTRHSQAVKKQVREELRTEGKLSAEYKAYGTVSLTNQFPSKMSIFQVVNALEEFLGDHNKSSLPFPPMEKSHRKVIADLASAYYISTKVIGQGKNRFVLCTKTYKSSFRDRDIDLIDLIVQSQASKKLPIARPKVQANGGGKKSSNVPKKQKAVKTFQENDIVGHDADELDSSNLGRQMLEKLGWKEGMALGHTNSGILAPIMAKIKTTKYGLGS